MHAWLFFVIHIPLPSRDGSIINFYIRNRKTFLYPSILLQPNLLHHHNADSWLTLVVKIHIPYGSWTIWSSTTDSCSHPTKASNPDPSKQLYREVIYLTDPGSRSLDLLISISVCLLAFNICCLPTQNVRHDMYIAYLDIETNEIYLSFLGCWRYLIMNILGERRCVHHTETSSRGEAEVRDFSFRSVIWGSFLDTDHGGAPFHHVSTYFGLFHFYHSLTIKTNPLSSRDLFPWTISN